MYRSQQAYKNMHPDLLLIFKLKIRKLNNNVFYIILTLHWGAGSGRDLLSAGFYRDYMKAIT